MLDQYISKKVRASLALGREELRARNKEMLRLHTEEGKTLQEVGDIYGISRERVRQLIGSLGYGYPAAYDNKIIASHPELTNGELCSILGRSRVSRGDHRHAIAGGAAKAGAQIEDKVSAKLSELGIAHKSMPHAHPFDILLENGKRIDVKASFRKMHPPTSKNEYYSFGTKKDVRGDDYCDFFILVVVPTMDMFIVPNEAVRPGCQQIHMNWPATRKPSKFHQYLNRFDLLEGE